MNPNQHTSGGIRLVTLGILGAVLLLAGCSAMDKSQNKTSASFGKNASQQSINKSAGDNSFPTAQQVGL
jgi:hypothetical protein